MSSKAFDDVLQADAINKAMGRKEGSESLKDIPRWNIRVDGRKFSKYRQMSKKKPRRSLLGLPMADPCSWFATTVAMTNTVRVERSVWGEVGIVAWEFTDHTDSTRLYVIGHSLTQPLTHPSIRPSIHHGCLCPLQITDLVYTSYFVALSMAFNDYSRINFWTILDLIGSCIYVIDLVAEFHIGFMVRWDNETVIILDSWEVFKYYTTKSTFFVDFFASLPIILQILFIAAPEYGNNATAVRLLQLLRLLRLLRVATLIRRMGRVGEGGSTGNWLATKVSTLTMFLLRIIFTFTVLLNLLACLWWWIAVTEGGGDSWVLPLSEAKPELNLYNATTGELTRDGLGAWLVCAYYALVTMSTIGYGDITPVTYAEIGLALVFILLGVSYFGYVISSVSEIATMSKGAELDQAAMLEELRGVEVWMNQNGFRSKVKQEIRRFFNTSYLPHTDADRESHYYDSLPLWLRTKVLKSLMSNSEALEQFTGIRLHPLSEIAKVVVRAISATAVPLHLRAGDVIFTRGEDAEYVYLLEEGEAGSLMLGESEPYVIQSPGVLGTSVVFSETIPLCGMRPLTAFAQTPATVWRIEGKDVYNRLLAWAPISLVHILDNYLESLDRYYKYYDSRSKDGFYVDRVKFDEYCGQIRKEASELRSHLVEASTLHFEKDVERGIIEEGGVDHRSFYKILNRKSDGDGGDGSEDTDVPEDRANPVMLGKSASMVMDTLNKIGSFTQVFQRLKDRRQRDRDPAVFVDDDELVAPRDDDSMTNRRLI